MGAKAGRKGAKSYNIRTVGNSTWRKFLDKMRRTTARRAAIKDNVESTEGWNLCVEHSDPDCECCRRGRCDCE